MLATTVPIAPITKTNIPSTWNDEQTSINIVKIVPISGARYMELPTPIKATTSATIKSTNNDIENINSSASLIASCNISLIQTSLTKSFLNVPFAVI